MCACLILASGQLIWSVPRPSVVVEGDSSALVSIAAASNASTTVLKEQVWTL